MTCYAIVNKKKVVQTLDELGLIGSAAVSYDDGLLNNIIRENELKGYKVIEIELPQTVDIKSLIRGESRYIWT